MPPHRLFLEKPQVNRRIEYLDPTGATACQVRIWTDIAVDVPNDGSQIADVVTTANMDQTMSAVVWDGIEHTISECCTSPVYADTVESWTQVLSIAAVMQNSAAHSRARELAKAVGGRLAESNHPVNGERPDIDDILNVPTEIIAPKGAEPSAFAGPLMERLSAQGSPVSQYSVLTNGDTNGLTAEFPYSGNRSSVELAAMQQAVPPETALLQIMTDQAHPELGGRGVGHLEAANDDPKCRKGRRRFGGERPVLPRGRRQGPHRVLER